MGTSLHIQVTGFVGSDPVVRQVGEQTVASYSVAVSRKNKAGGHRLYPRVEGRHGG